MCASQCSKLHTRKCRSIKTYRPDFICYDQIIVELKCQYRLTGLEESQIINYLRIANMHVGLLMNFGARPKLEWSRYVI